MWKATLFCAFLAAVSSCDLSFSCGITVTYTLSGSSIIYDFQVPESVYSYYGWVGFGLKKYEDGYSMIHGDYVTIVIESGLMEDRVGGDRNARPKTDEDVGGVDNLYNKEVWTDDNGVMHFSWTRDYVTGDTNDIDIVPGNQYYAQWAVGIVANEVLKHHEDKGYSSFFMGECSEATSFLEIN